MAMIVCLKEIHTYLPNGNRLAMYPGQNFWLEDEDISYLNDEYPGSISVEDSGEVTLLYAPDLMSPLSPIENERLSLPVGASVRIFAYNGDPSNIDTSDFDINNLTDITSISSSNSEVATVELDEVPEQPTTAVVTNQILSGTENAIITVSAGGRTMTFTAICEGMA